MKHATLLISLLLVFATMMLIGCAPTPTLPSPTFTPSPLPPTFTSTPEPTATTTPTLTPTPALVGWILYEENEWMTLSYPPDWKVESPREHACIPGSSDCIIRLSHSPSENIEIEIYRLPKMIPSFNNVKDADNYDWQGKEMSAMIVQAPDALKLISRSEITVGELPAIRRLYEYPLVDPSTYKIKATQYNYQVLVLKNGDSFFVRMTTTNSNEFDQYLDIVDKLVETITFQK